MGERNEPWPGAHDPDLPEPDRREHPRIPTPPLRTEGTQAKIQDVSLGGICLETDARFVRGDRFSLVLTDARVESSCRFDAAVQWTEPERVGLRWLRLTPEQELWLCDSIVGSLLEVVIEPAGA